MFCSNCGKEIQENSKFCPICGTVLKKFNISYNNSNNEEIHNIVGKDEDIEFSALKRYEKEHARKIEKINAIISVAVCILISILLCFFMKLDEVVIKPREIIGSIKMIKEEATEKYGVSIYKKENLSGLMEECHKNGKEIKLDSALIGDDNKDGRIDCILLTGKGMPFKRYRICGLECGMKYKNAIDIIKNEFEYLEDTNLASIGTGLDIIYYKSSNRKLLLKIYANNLGIITQIGCQELNNEESSILDDNNSHIKSNNKNDEEFSADNDDYMKKENSEHKAENDEEENISQEAIDARWDDSDSYILPNSDTEKVDEEEIKKLNLKTVQFAIDEICARNGRGFENNRQDYPDMKEYFEGKLWYEKIYEPKEFDAHVKDILNEVEYYNFNLLAKVRDEKRKSK